MERCLADHAGQATNFSGPYVTFWSAGVGPSCRDLTSPNTGTGELQLLQGPLERVDTASPRVCGPKRGETSKTNHFL